MATNESVTFTMFGPPTFEPDVVHFMGKEVAQDFPTRFVTAKGAVVVMFGEAPEVSDEDFAIFESLDEFRRDVTNHLDPDGVRDRALQPVENELGNAPAPRMLDI